MELSAEKRDRPSDLVSVVIPAYNREHEIGRCLKSIIRQSYANLEIIVVDDHSTDGTVKAAQSVGDERVIVISNTRTKGAQAARNAGVLASRGAWIAFQDSDDQWLPNKIERQYQIAMEMVKLGERDVFIHSDVYIYNASDKKKWVWNLPKISGPLSYKKLLAHPGPAFNTFFISRNALNKIGLLDENIPAYQEWDTAIRLARICAVQHISEPLAVYWKHSGETISQDHSREVSGYKYIVLEHREEILRYLGRNALDWHMGVIANLMISYRMSGEWRSCLRCVRMFSMVRIRVYFNFVKKFLSDW